MRWLWRISEHADLTGLGGEKASARWHTKAPGKRIVYLAEHPAVCLIEALVNLKGNLQFFPDSFQLVKVGVDQGVSELALAYGEGDWDKLSEDWRADTVSTRRLGDTWLSAGGSALLGVPSAPSPESVNYLLNPLHPDSKGVAIVWQKRISYDQRLFQVWESG